MSRLADKAQFKVELAKIIAQFNGRGREQTFAGAASRPTLEHVTRRHFVDPFLRALGWDLTQFNEQVIEEAQIRGETTLRLDYLGLNQQTRVPVLIVEAKRWAAPFIAPSAKEASTDSFGSSRPISLICAAIEHMKNGGAPKDSPAILEWADYLSKLHQYVVTVKNESGHIVTRVATLSGQWLMTFNDPKAIFLEQGKVNPLLIGIYRGDELIIHAEEIFDQLARSSINDDLPSPIRPSLAPAYIRAEDVKHAYRALWISRQTMGPSWKPRPNLDIAAAIILERRDGALLIIIEESFTVHSMPHNYGELSAHIAAVEAQSDELLRQLNRELGAALQPEPVDAFPGFPASTMSRRQKTITPLNQSRVDLIKLNPLPGEFLLVTGTAKHFLLETPTIESCDWHDWACCQTQAQQRGQRPIVARSVEPRAFFATREGHHCAHRLVHDRRSMRCQIDAFEEFLCCRSCVLQTFCWTGQELAGLPCGTVPTAGAI